MAETSADRFKRHEDRMDRLEDRFDRFDGEFTKIKERITWAVWIILASMGGLNIAPEILANIT